MVSPAVVATVVLGMVTASFPFYVYGAWIIVDTERVTWAVLVHHLRYVGTGLVLTTVPVVGWMAPRLLDQLGEGLATVHAVVGLQAYALLVFGLTGIGRIFMAKRAHGLYRNPDQDLVLSDLHENADHWRRRLRIGVFGYVILWLVAYLLGVTRYVLLYVLTPTPPP